MNEEVRTSDELAMTRRMLSAATIRVQHYEQALRRIRGWREIDRNSLRERLEAIEGIVTEALETDTPVEQST